MGLHVFFGCYFNLFRLMAKCGVLENLLVKVGIQHTGWQHDPSQPTQPSRHISLRDWHEKQQLLQHQQAVHGT